MKDSNIQKMLVPQTPIKRIEKLPQLDIKIRRDFWRAVWADDLSEKIPSLKKARFRLRCGFDESEILSGSVLKIGPNGKCRWLSGKCTWKDNNRVLDVLPPDRDITIMENVFRNLAYIGEKELGVLADLVYVIGYGYGRVGFKEWQTKSGVTILKHRGVYEADALGRIYVLTFELLKENGFYILPVDDVQLTKYGLTPKGNVIISTTNETDPYAIEVYEWFNKREGPKFKLSLVEPPAKS